MPHLTRIGLLSLTVALLGAEEEKDYSGSMARLTFMDETSISGSVLSVDTKKETLRLKSPSLKGTSTLRTAQLLDVQFDHEASPPEADHYALTTIKPRYDKSPPQDTIRGEFIGINQEYITLQTWYAGELKLKRSMVQGLNIFENSPRLFNGPASLEGWVTSSGKVEDNWDFKQRSLISKSTHTIARKIEMGEKVKLSFNVAWKNSPQFRMSFLANTGKEVYASRGYILHVQSSYLQLYRTGSDNIRSDLFSEGFRELREQETALFEIYLDRNPEGKNGLYIDGKKVTAWEDSNDLKGMGDWLVFAPRNNVPIKISNIIVNQWNGKLPADEEQQDTRPEGIFKGLSGERIDLANGDAVLGEVTGITEGMAKLKTDLGEMEVPVPRLSSFELNPIEDEPRMYGHDVRAWFVEGGSVTLRIDALTPKKLRGYSQVFGEAEFDLKAFSRIEFNVWSPKRESYTAQEEW